MKLESTSLKIWRMGENKNHKKLKMVEIEENLEFVKLKDLETKRSRDFISLWNVWKKINYLVKEFNVFIKISELTNLKFLFSKKHLASSLWKSLIKKKINFNSNKFDSKIKFIVN